MTPMTLLNPETNPFLSPPLQSQTSRDLQYANKLGTQYQALILHWYILRSIELRDVKLQREGSGGKGEGGRGHICVGSVLLFGGWGMGFKGVSQLGCF